MSFFKTLLRLILNPSLQVLQNTGRLPSAAKGETQSGERPHMQKKMRFFNPPLVFGLLIVTALVVLMLAGPFLMEQDPYITSQAVVPHFDSELNKMVRPPFPPSQEHPLGTDYFGNDILTGLVYGSRMTLVVAACITLARVFLGAFLGMIAGWNLDRWPDRLITSVVGVVTSIPMLLSSMILIFALGVEKGFSVFIIALAFIGWTEITQQVRGEMLVIRKMGYIEGAKAAGLNALQVVVRHALPNLLPKLLVLAFLDMGAVLILLAELGFLGVYIGGGSLFSMDPTYGGSTLMMEVPEWGAMLARGTPSLRSHPHLILGPALAFFISVLSLNMLGEGLRRAMDRNMLSTAFILRKEGLIAAAILVLGIALVLNYTGPILSFQRLAASFQGEQVLGHNQALSGSDAGEGTADPTVPEEYIQQQYKQYGLRPGLYLGINSAFSQNFQVVEIEPANEPRLMLETEPGAGEIFHFGSDFQYVLEGQGGSGNVEAPVAYLSYDPALLSPNFRRIPFTRMGSLNFSGKIVMVFEEGLPPAFDQAAMEMGARGILFISDQESLFEQPVYQVQRQEGEAPVIPILRIQRSVAEAIMGSGGLKLDEISQHVSEEAFTLQELEARVSISLDLADKQVFDIPVTVGFMPGYDQNLADDLIILLASYDQPAQAGQQNLGQSSGVGLMLEMARLLQAEQLDPRRSMLFVAWGNDAAGKIWAETFLEQPANFSKLSIPSRQTVQPKMVIHLDDIEVGNELIWVHPKSDRELLEMFSRSAQKAGLPIRTGEIEEEAQPVDPLSLNIPSLLIQSSPDPNPGSQTQTSATDRMDKLGESLSLFVVQILRQEIY